MSNLSDFEADVIAQLATLEERTRGLDDLQADVADIKGKVRLLEFKASMFGAAAGAAIVAVKQIWGK